MMSIRRWLLGWLIFGLAAACLIAGYGIFHSARHEAGELFDYELRTVALSMPANIATTDGAEHSERDFNALAEDRIAIDIWSPGGTLIYHSAKEPVLPQLSEGFRTIERDEFRWRVFGVQQADRYVQIAQPYSVRDDLAARLALRTLWPLALLVPVTIAFVLLIVARGLAPIGSLSRALANRSIDSLDPVVIDERVPVEIRPLVDALNDLLERLSVASKAQRTFVADAAHELRTPLTALKLQLQAAKPDALAAPDAPVIERLEGRVNRIIHLAQQLLSMAREDARHEKSMIPVSLRRVAEQSVSDLSLLAEAKQIDLGLDARGPATSGDGNNTYTVLGDEQALGILLKNLVDNAIRYTPAGGRVDVVLTRDTATGGVLLEVADTGPGIAEDELKRVFDRFYRGSSVKEQGSGLGLAIASSIAARHRAILAVSNRTDGSGLSIRLNQLPTVSV
ncbi:ATP-binding protein [Caballeronia sp. LjRoot29]|uniref:ATP-binding protein n=1 Tax=Caballeronia sp. LjRoot29 TaxID=3342315 RepID=UPI003ED073DC